MLLLDTHVLLWLVEGDPKLGARARGAIDQAWQSDQLGASASSFWEAAWLQDRGRIQLAEDLERWRRAGSEFPSMARSESAPSAWPISC